MSHSHRDTRILSKAKFENDCGRKVQHPTIASANVAAYKQGNPRIIVYKCDWCSFYHLGKDWRQK